MHKYDDIISKCIIATFNSNLEDLLSDIGFKNIRRITLIDDKRCMKSTLKGCDVIISNGEKEEFLSEVSSELGIPFITGKVVTVILPDGYKYKDLNLSRFEDISHTPDDRRILESIQIKETINVLTDDETPLFAPKAIKIENKKLKKINLFDSLKV
ncbi:MAG: hypothetical protein EF806_03870 [Candidatus Methanoliparum thermophilum]|uniref:Uncharacterized protein n=1 Tax=Methanoliparum thermophilum TaxID=2491083 RepID=A0A520KRS6_METT2|nr:hypothetical protein [Candidatus Methanoliparum sp. LAM-1]RZN64492.1 MAG: hypothetical protein EF806_03870 [Candidatus Methanoliparum thermophilum]BDC35918.1 hypothetical protein MTLP_06000 [Candidatus Methanoliparum sp. LAM-1]